jgi:hypothetical protein
MTVRIGKMTFSDWISLPFQDGWSDTFIFRIDAQACIPPFEFAPLLKRMAAHTFSKRSSASLWVQVDAPGEWYAAEVIRSLKGLAVPFVVTRTGITLNYVDFSFPPKLLYSQSQPPPVVEDKQQSLSLEELRCLQALGRMLKGSEQEVASQAGLPVELTSNLLDMLKAKKLTVYKISPKIKRDKSKPEEMDLFPLWHPKSRGLSLALRSWGVPTALDFKNRTEENLQQIGTPHRSISRSWSEWLRSAWPQAEIWTGWSEVRIPGISVIPDALAWGKIQGYETLFWLEVGDEHKRRDKITDITARRLNQAWELYERTGVRIVYVQLSTNWVHKAARWACVNLPKEVAVVMGNRSKFGELPMLEWGRVTG